MGGICLCLVVIGASFSMKDSSARELKIAFQGSWRTTHPGLQHTLVGDLTLSNQFEALVAFSGVGKYVALAAKHWTISPDYRVFRFDIDTSRKFSDGVPLAARHFKESWENSYRLNPQSANSSLLDVLYKLEGFSEFDKKGEFTGVKVIDDATLEVRFSSPFRMALEHLSGNRFAAFREVDGKFLGTGAYVIEDLGNERLRMTPNPYYPTPAKNPILLSSVVGSQTIDALETGEVDAVAYVMASTVSSDVLKTKKNLSTVVGQDALHRALYMNGQKGRLFANVHYRQALQYLVYEYLKDRPELIGNPAFTSFDMQVYLPLQSGRIDENEVTVLVKKGKPYVEGLLEAARKSPPVLIETRDNSMRSVLEAVGLTLSEKSRIVDKSTIIDIIYMGEEADLIPGNFGIASGDPDGIYHKLGRSGAIASPMTNNAAVAELLEIGRSLIAKDELDPFYQKVNREILEQVPFVHLGFNKAISVYRNDRIKVERNLLRRNEGDLLVFEALE